MVEFGQAPIRGFITSRLRKAPTPPMTGSPNILKNSISWSPPMCRWRRGAPGGGAPPLGPSGRLFTEESIGMALGMRELHRHLREATGQQTIHSNFSRQDRSRFLGELENEIQAIKRRVAI